MALVCTVAVLFLPVTGPVFQLVQSSVRYTDFHIYIQKMEAALKKWRDGASDLFDPGYTGILMADLTGTDLNPENRCLHISSKALCVCEVSPEVCHA